MTILDTILLIVLSGFVFYGLFFGLIRTLGTFFGVIVGAFVASHYYILVASWFEQFFFGYNNLGKVLVFLILFSLASRLTSFLFSILDRAFNIISIIPFLKTFNRLGGALLGFFTGGLILGLIIYVASKYAIIGTWVGSWLVDSQIAPFLLKFVDFLLPLLPEALKMVQGII